MASKLRCVMCGFFVGNGDIAKTLPCVCTTCVKLNNFLKENKEVCMGITFQEQQLSEIVFNLGVDLKNYFGQSREIRFKSFHKNELQFTVEDQTYGYNLVTCDWYFYLDDYRMENSITAMLSVHFNGKV